MQVIYKFFDVSFEEVHRLRRILKSDSIIPNTFFICYWLEWGAWNKSNHSIQASKAWRSIWSVTVFSFLSVGCPGYHYFWNLGSSNHITAIMWTSWITICITVSSCMLSQWLLTQTYMQYKMLISWGPCSVWWIMVVYSLISRSKPTTFKCSLCH